MKYLIAIFSGLIVYTGGLLVGGRLGLLDASLFPLFLLIISEAAVIAVIRPWVRSEGPPRPPGQRLGVWLAAIGCAILVLLVDGIGGFLYTCARTSCMP